MDSTHDEKTANNSSTSNNSLTFEYFQEQFLLDCLLRIPWTSDDQKSMFELCLEQLAASRSDLRDLVEFKESYTSDRALWWYLRECFLYKIINNCLESADIRYLFHFRRVLRDLEDEIQRRRSTTPVHVYRSQLMSRTSIDRWINSVGQCLVVKSFLSATLDLEVAQTFLKSNEPISDDYERVLIEIDADPRVNGSRPFVQLNSLNYVKDPNEVLFCFGSIFLLNHIQCGNDGIYRIELTLYTDAENELKMIVDDLRTKHFRPKIDLLDFAQILVDCDRFNEAEQYVNQRLEQLTKTKPHLDTSRCYRLLASIALAENHFDASLNWLNKALEFDLENSTNETTVTLADDHEQIGDVYSRKGSVDQALNHYSAALEIRQSSLSSDDETVGRIYEHLARLYQLKGDVSGARSCLQRALRIYQKLPKISAEKLVEIEEKLRR